MECMKHYTQDFKEKEDKKEGQIVLLVSRFDQKQKEGDGASSLTVALTLQTLQVWSWFSLHSNISLPETSYTN